MTEAEWLACTDPQPMLDFLRDKASDRKLRLFALACCCRLMRLLTDQRSVNVILATDRYLDGTASREQLTEAGIAARLAYENAFQPHEHAVYAACRSRLTTRIKRLTVRLPPQPTLSAMNLRQAVVPRPKSTKNSSLGRSARKQVRW